MLGGVVQAFGFGQTDDDNVLPVLDANVALRTQVLQRERETSIDDDTERNLVMAR